MDFLEGREAVFLVEEREENYRNFERLDAWKFAHAFVLEIYKLTSKFPGEEKFGLVSQLRRAAASIPANIAEGTGKGSVKDVIRFLCISRGSLEECKYYLILSRDLGFITVEDFHRVKETLDRTGRILNGLITSLEKKLP